MEKNISYILEIENKKLDLLHQYYEILKDIQNVDIKEEEFEQILINYLDRLSFIFNELKEYNKIFNSIIKNNNQFLNYLSSEIENEERLKKQIENIIDKIIEKYFREKNEIQNKLKNLKIQSNNPLTENNPRFFEKKI
ncbi:MAG: hypothetical protein ACK4YF_09025 [Exilispira sp.]